MPERRPCPVARRRRLLGALAYFALCAAGSAHAQPARKRFRVGTLTSAWAANHPAVEGLREGLAALGLKVPQSVLLRADRVIE